MMMMLLILNITFLMSKHPLSMGVILILQTLCMGIISGKMMKTFFMSYILTITILSGMLVLFIYMSSVASNEKFKLSPKSTIMVMIIMIFSLPTFNKMIIKNNYLGGEMSMMKMSEIMPLSKMFIMSSPPITLLMVVYLFITMVVSSFLVNISEGPMRMKTLYV